MDNENAIEQIEQEPQTPIIAEDTRNDNTPNAYETIIAQQQAQINALIEQSNTLTQQITNMVQNGAQFNSQLVKTETIGQKTANDMFNPKSLAETDSFLSMEDLAKEIGKR